MSIRLIIIFIVALYYNPIFSQKKCIDTTSLSLWPNIVSVATSNNGNYVLYRVTEGDENNLIVQSTKNSEKRIFKNTISGDITPDEKFIILQFENDTIGIIKLPLFNKLQLFKGSEYKVSKEGKGSWITFFSNKENQQAVLKDLRTDLSINLNNIEDYHFSNNGNLLLQIKMNNLHHLVLKDLSKKNTDLNISSNFNKYENITFSTDGDQITCIVREKEKYVLKYYRLGMDSLRNLVTSDNLELFPEWAITEHNLSFSPQGDKIYFSINKNTYSDEKSTSNVRIWSYNSPQIISQEIKQKASLVYRTYTALVNIDNGKVVLLDKPGDNWIIHKTAKGTGEYALVSTEDNVFEEDWRISARFDSYLVSTKNGSRKLVTSGLLTNNNFPILSPSGQYVLWYDRIKKQYVCYNITKNTKKIVSNNIPYPLYNTEDEKPTHPISFGLAAWDINDEYIYIYDKFDIWKIDPEGAKIPINITNEYGRKNNIVLRYISPQGEEASSLNCFNNKDEILLCGFNRSNKNNGFFSKNFKKKGNPTLLHMSPNIYIYQFLPYPTLNIKTIYPIKARNKNLFILQRMSSTEFPNLFCTEDFKNFKQLSFFQPQKNYNWLTTELIKWTTFDGKSNEGVLYKPEDFDSTKKYPLLVNFYEKNSNALNSYLSPDWSGGNINIPWFVSNGYVVFVPNIKYTIGEPGESAYNSVVSGVRKLIENSWIDSTRMGIQGHSFGGYEVNFIITKTDIFKAAISAAGPTDFISLYGSLRSAWGVTAQNLFETDQNRVGKTLWEEPLLYLKNSPVIFADKVKTPLLIMHNDNDGQVPWEQGIEYFLALRRLNKKVWLLQYEGEGHQLYKNNDTRDYTLKMTEFFNYLLKTHTKPDWITD